MKLWFTWFIVIVLTLSISSRPKHHAKLSLASHRKLVKKTVRRIRKAHVQMKRVIDQKNQLYPSRRKLIVDDSNTMDLLIQEKRNVYGFRWKGDNYIRCPHPEHYQLDMLDPRRSYKRPKVLMPLYDRYKERPLSTAQMDCTLEFRNYGLNYHSVLRMATLQVEFQSSCMKNTFTTYFYIDKLDRDNIPLNVKLMLKNKSYALEFNEQVTQEHPNDVYGHYSFTNGYDPKFFITNTKKRRRPRKSRKSGRRLIINNISGRRVKPKKIRKTVNKAQTRNLKDKAHTSITKARKPSEKRFESKSSKRKVDDHKHESLFDDENSLFSMPKTLARKNRKQNKESLTKKTTRKTKASKLKSHSKERRLSVTISRDDVNSPGQSKKQNRNTKSSHSSNRKLPVVLVPRESSEKISAKIMQLQRILDEVSPYVKKKWRQSGVKADIIPGTIDGLGFHRYDDLVALWSSKNISKCELDLVKTRMLSKWIVKNGHGNRRGPRWLRTRVSQRYYGMICTVAVK